MPRHPPPKRCGALVHCLASPPLPVLELYHARWRRTGWSVGSASPSASHILFLLFFREEGKFDTADVFCFFFSFDLKIDSLLTHTYPVYLHWCRKLFFGGAVLTLSFVQLLTAAVSRASCLLALRIRSTCSAAVRDTYTAAGISYRSAPCLLFTRKGVCEEAIRFSRLFAP